MSMNIHPGGWSVQADRPLSTILGSCVAVCFFDPKLRLGGLNHFMLPSRLNASREDTDIILNGDYAMEVLVNAMLNKGAAKSRLIAKAFGGGTIVSSIRMAIGERNIDFTKEWLDREGIPLMASDFGGPWSRKVIFNPGNGEAFCRRMPITQAGVAEAVKEEAEYEKTLIIKPKEKRVELF